MKLDLTPRQAAWLRDALRRVDEGQNLDDEELRTLARAVRALLRERGG